MDTYKIITNFVHLDFSLATLRSQTGKYTKQRKNYSMIGKKAATLQKQMDEQENPIGFLQPVDSNQPYPIDLNAELIRSPETTFLGRVRGESMASAEIHNGDILVIDKEAQWDSDSLVVAHLHDDFTLGRIMRREDGTYLQPTAPEQQAIRLEAEVSLRVWGVVTWILHKAR